MQKVYRTCNVACKLVVKATQHTCVHGDLIVLKLSGVGSLLLPPETSTHVWLLFALKHTGIDPITTYKEHSVVVRFLLFALNQSGIGPWSQLVTNILVWGRFALKHLDMDPTHQNILAFHQSNCLGNFTSHQ